MTAAPAMIVAGSTSASAVEGDDDAVDQTVAHILDALDRHSATATEPLDPISFLNQHCDKNKLLRALPALRTALHNRLVSHDDHLTAALTTQSETASATRQHVSEAQQSVLALQQRCRHIQEQAALSEAAVRDITKDLARLDGAQKRLQTTITTLKRLHMLVQAAEQLRQCAVVKEDKTQVDYHQPAHLIDAIRLLLDNFSAYLNVPTPLRVLAQSVQANQDKLRVEVVAGLRKVAFGVSENTTTPIMTLHQMKGGILMLDALGTKVWQKFQYDFCQELLKPYTEKFAPQAPEEKKPEKRISSFKKETNATEVTKAPAPCKLEQLEKRFTWFRDLASQQVQEKFPGVFPAHWNFHGTLTTMFLQTTRDHILALLDGPSKDADAGNATVLLKALQTTLLFEKDSTAWLQREFGTVFDDKTTPAPSAEESTASNTKKPSPMKSLFGIASTAFELYMGPYIRLEEQSMDEQLVKALEDCQVDTRGERPVFISSTNLFVYIKGSITRCKALTKGSAFYLLFQAFQTALRKYAQTLNGKLPNAIPNPISIVPNHFGGGPRQDATTASYKLPAGEEDTVCHVIATCEYCADTTEALEDLIRDTIEEEYKSKVDMGTQMELFHDTTAKSIRVLVSGLSNRTEATLKSMSTINWGAFQSVGEESSYVRKVYEEIQPAVIKIRSLLPTSYFRSFCDKFGTLFSDVYFETLVRLKRINEPGTQQLLLDVYSLKTLFLKLPILEEEEKVRGSSPIKKIPSAKSTIAPAMYTKLVQKQFGRIETLLKLVATPTEMLIDNFRVQWTNGKQSDLQTILNLKGTPRKEQLPILERFGGTADSASTAVVSIKGLASATMALQGSTQEVAAKVSSDMNQTVDGFRQMISGSRFSKGS